MDDTDSNILIIDAREKNITTTEGFIEFINSKDKRNTAIHSARCIIGRGVISYSESYIESVCDTIIKDEKKNLAKTLLSLDPIYYYKPRALNN